MMMIFNPITTKGRDVFAGDAAPRQVAYEGNIHVILLRSGQVRNTSFDCNGSPGLNNSFINLS